MNDENNFNAMAYRLRIGDLVIIKNLKIYGHIIDSWETKDENGVIKYNYIVKDMIDVEHERYEDEIELVDDINDSINKAKCNAPLETIIEWFNKIDNRFQLTIEVSSKKENDHSDVIVPYVYVRYGNYNKPCIIKDGKLFIPEEENYLPKDDEYECCLWYYDADVKKTVFELYMNIITRKQL